MIREGFFPPAPPTQAAYSVKPRVTTLGREISPEDLEIDKVVFYRDTNDKSLNGSVQITNIDDDYVYFKYKNLENTDGKKKEGVLNKEIPNGNFHMPNGVMSGAEIFQTKKAFTQHLVKDDIRRPAEVGGKRRSRKRNQKKSKKNHKKQKSRRHRR